ncbi:aminoglycoside phosphotransferase family protein [Arthrobacter sp. zg-Y820]|uniref:aminoglycoside phosphotransferase family protein n=1 Tax=unclassified Arthrobacter TaxID=235627 RepID=UPI001E2BFB01|nr:MULTISPECIES: aminoglycoside phosphotransferase family protein [unclassified Arthrobacter]MCC9198081.1 aminoglycoside phosphotransferase family protein [Arthrobacter sp. zg-Y820]MDK1280948.1 aminoglycoside phosphotransferase family protein [Arthrobacter sp. zg.Y820]WIB10422.1 aminoglycoside phosphotransferase family protein [Arthrobacter sp. zg-Y820]
MANHPPAEIFVDESLVRRLLQEQHPHLADRPLRPVANGWDNYIFRLGTDYAVRLPRRLSAAALTANEQVWLPALTADLTVATSAPLYAGSPSEAFPWPWNVTRWFPGTAVSLQPRDRNVALAAPLAGFLNAFHRPAPPDFPRNPVRGVPLASRNDAVRGRLDSGMVPHAARIRELWEASLELPVWPGPALWIHGDLHPANLVGAADGTLQAVIDFGDLTAGDPATDLAAAWLVFDRTGRNEFRKSLGTQYDADPHVWGRAQGWAVCMASSLLANSDDHPGMYLLGSETLMEILTEGPDWP